MKQLDLFERCTPEDVEPKKDGDKWVLYVDGAARNNPGPAGIGIYILKNDKPLHKKGFYIGIKTNNQAEYLALLCGVFLCKEEMAYNDALYIMSDSELLIRQLKGEYKVKKPHLKDLYAVACTLLSSVQYSVCHIVRENNVIADALANLGLDKKVHVPQPFSDMLQKHDISL